MIYRNDNITITDDYVKGTIKDLMEYFKYQIAHLCLNGSIDYDTFIYNTRQIIDLIEELEKETDTSKTIKVEKLPMGNYRYKEEEL